MKNIDEFFDRVRVAFAYHDFDEWQHLSKIINLKQETDVMTNDIMKTNGTNLPTTNDDAVDAMLRETARSNPQLRFKEGKYHIGEDQIELGHEYIAFPMDWVRGWVKWHDGKIVEARLQPYTEPMPTREELGDLDRDEWEVDDKTGLPRDPWQPQNVLPLEDAETGEYLIFTTSSVGGRIAIEKLCNFCGRNYKQGRQSGFPVIKLQAKDMPTRFGGTKPRPDFMPIVRWHDLPPIAEDMNDEIGI